MTDKTHDYTPLAGERVEAAANALCALRDQTGRRVTASFNGIELVADTGTTPGDIVSAFNAEMDRLRAEADRKRAAFEATPEGQEQLRKAEERRAFVEAEVAKGVLPFSVAKPEEWEDCLGKNSDPYGACAVRYAARWANYMERDIAKGAELEAIARDTSHEADIEGVTGFMHGCAVSILSQVWEHGEQLRRWHNKATQIGTEGDKANESGGVLNPALMTIG